MGLTYNIYCDESCHLENDGQRAMVLGAVSCPVEKTREIAVRLREIKDKHGMPSPFEAKWTKVSAAKVQLYLDLVDYFFDDDDLHFRALVVPDKTLLNHNGFDQNHDSWYYKMYFDMLKVIFDPKSTYRVYIDIKDTRGTERVKHLHEVLCNSIYDFSKDVLERVQQVHSNEIEQMQLTDLLIGAIGYVNREQSGNEGKNQIIKRIRQRSGYSLVKSTLLREEKLNLFRWQASRVQA